MLVTYSSVFFFRSVFLSRLCDLDYLGGSVCVIAFQLVFVVLDMLLQV